MNLSLVVPCYNEEGNIKNLIEKCEKFLSNQKHELILVNNGSTDNTEKKIDEFLNIPNIKNGLLCVMNHIGKTLMPW